MNTYLFSLTWYWTLGSASSSLLASPVPQVWDSSADLLFHDSRYIVAQITLKKLNMTKPTSSRNSPLPLKKTQKMRPTRAGTVRAQV